LELPAPEFPAGAAWMNSQPFTLSRLKGRRVVVVAFINPNSVDSLRVLPAIERWWEEYALDGLMIIGVHTPDYDFDRDPMRLRTTLKRFKIKFPVVIDSQREIWKAYANEGWPAYFLIDPAGRIVFERLGDSQAAEFERAILGALEKFKGFRRAEPLPEEPARVNCGQATRPIYLGSRRGGKVVPLTKLKVETLGETRDGEVGSAGPWSLEPDGMRADAGGESGAKLRLIYRGSEALAVLSRTGNRLARIYLKQDTLWLHSGNAGADVRWDSSQHSYVQLSEPRLYYLTKNPSGAMHELVLSPEDSGTAVHGFEFSDFCLNNYPHN
jgi:peroxiredoxin